MLWILIALMTAAAVMAVLWPLSRRAHQVETASDLAVYKDQLEEIGRDQSFGLIAPTEAEAARVEVSRRILAAADADAKATKPAREAPFGRRAVAVVALAVLPVCAISIYLAVGSPDLPGQPLASRAAAPRAGEPSVAELFARVERHLEQNPQDGRGWEVVAPIYMRLGRFDDAVKARRNALRLLGTTAERESDLGEALVSQANGVVTGDAKAAFEEALKLDPKEVTARFYSGLAAEQDGRTTEAARIWRALAADAPEGAGWLASVQRALARVETPAGAAPPAQQGDMIRAMVERLAERLRRDGSDVDGWIQLVRSYTVLEDAGRAQGAAEDARKALAGDADKLARLEAGLRTIAAAPASGAAAPPKRDDAVGNAPAQQGDMIRAMVERLAARLRRDGSDVDGWIQLVRSYVVLGETDKARAAVADAHRALEGDADKLRRLDDGARSLGVGG